MYKHVQERAPIVKKATYEEKVNGAFAPYTIVEKYDAIEDALWADSKTVGCRNIGAGLRNRYALLHLTSGILRCESLYRAELSDFLGITLNQSETDIHPPYIMINQIPLGKTNHGRVLYGRATRHRDVKLCCVGALSFYLTYRFSTAVSSSISQRKIG